MYDPFAAGLEGAAEEIWHCGFPDARITFTTDIGEALQDAAFVISSGGAPRKEGMTREDLLRGNCEIAKELGENLKRTSPDCKFCVVIFNPADITGLTVLVHSGLPQGRVTTLAALDSTRLQTALMQHFGVLPDEVTGCATYGGHGEKMAVFAGGIKVRGTALTEVLAGGAVDGRGMSADEWAAIQEHVRNGGARIIQLRGRSSFQSPAQQSIFMLRGYLGQPYDLPCGAYLTGSPYDKVMMALRRFGAEVSKTLRRAAADLGALRTATACRKLRDQVIEMGLSRRGEWADHPISVRGGAASRGRHG